MSFAQGGDARSPRVSDSVVNKLAALLMEAKRGGIEAVAVVTIDPSGRPKVHFAGEGDLVPSVNLGLDMLKASFMAQIVGAPGAAQMRSGIVIPGE